MAASRVSFSPVYAWFVTKALMNASIFFNALLKLSFSSCAERCCAGVLLLLLAAEGVGLAETLFLLVLSGVVALGPWPFLVTSPVFLAGLFTLRELVAAFGVGRDRVEDLSFSEPPLGLLILLALGLCGFLLLEFLLVEVWLN